MAMYDHGGGCLCGLRAECDCGQTPPKPPIKMVKPPHKSDGGSTNYYNIPAGASDLQDLIEFKNMNFSIGNIFKACYRMGEKDGTDALYDLNKIVFFAQREIARIKKTNP